MKRVLILIVAVSCGLFAAWLSLSDKPRTDMNAIASPAEPLPLVEVLVASKNMERGSRIEPSSFKWQEWPADSVSEGVIRRDLRPAAAEELSGSLVRIAMMQGEPVRPEKVAGGSGSFMSLVLAPGMRAVAVRINAETTAGGFILPDDRVDVVHTSTKPGPGGEIAGKSRTILRNVRVLAVDQVLDEANSSSVVGKTATLEVLPEQVEVVTTAESTGSVSLALRPVADNAVDASAIPVTVQAEAGRPRNMIKIIGSGKVRYVEPQSGS